MVVVPSHTITLFVPDAKTESEFLLTVNQMAVKAYRKAHPIPSLFPTPHDSPDDPPPQRDSLTSVA